MRTATVISNENYWTGASLPREDSLPIEIRATNEGEGVIRIGIVAGRLGHLTLYGTLTPQDARSLAQWLLAITAGATAA